MVMEKAICSQCGKELDPEKNTIIIGLDGKVICVICSDEWR